LLLDLALHGCWHYLGERELDVVLILILVGNHDQLLQELECVFALVDRAVLDANLEQTLAHVDHVDVLDCLRA